MQIFYNKIQGLTVEPTDSIQHVKDLIEVCSSVHTLHTLLQYETVRSSHLSC